MKIALVGPTPPPNGGMAMQTLQLSKLLRANAHQVTLIPVNPPYKPHFFAKIPVLRSLVRLIPYLLVLYSQFKKHDVIHVMANSGWSFYLFAMPAVWIAILTNTPVIINYRGGKAREFFSKSWKWLRSAFARSSLVIVPSGFLKEIFEDFGQQATIVPNIIDLSQFRYRQPDLQKEQLHLIVTRNLEPLYDNATAIRAFAAFSTKYPLASLTVAGSGPLLDELKALTVQLNVDTKVTFAGRLNRQQMAQLYQHADIMLNPSTIDNMPNSILEALASGVLVVSSDVGGIPYMVSDKTHALLVSPSQPEAMCSAIETLLLDPVKSCAMAQAGLKQVEQLTPDSVLPQLENIYRQVASNNA